jgi:uncharacterized protein YkwD
LRSAWLKQLCYLLALWGAVAAPAAWADPVAAVQLLRVSGCGGLLPAAPSLLHSRQLDGAAALWAGGVSPATAAVRSGYAARIAVGLRLSGPDDLLLKELRRKRCGQLADRSLRAIGAYRTAEAVWVLMASPQDAGAPTQTSGTTWTTLRPAGQPASQVSRSAGVSDDGSPARVYSYSTAPLAADSETRVLQLVNALRASGTHCGAKSYPPALPLTLSDSLGSAAAEHAADMARHDYFEHVDLKGKSPADRVRATGYRDRLVGENIAYGPTSADEVVAGWLHSTGHCENIMDPRFVQMGLAVRSGHGSRHGPYWDQVLAAPQH